MQTVLLTGASGALGMALLPRLLSRHPSAQVCCLLRPAHGSSAAERLNALGATLGLPEAARARLSVLEGDVSNPRFGLDEASWQTLAEQTDTILHLAASVEFTQPLPEARCSNVDSTRQVLDLARRAAARHGNAFRLGYVSTAYVSGRRAGPLYEHELRLDQEFWNAYEQSKAEAEQLVRDAAGEVPVTILRPSQIIGDSATGRVHKFFGFYEFVALGVRGRSNVLVADPAVRPDMVPSDFVADGLLHLCAAPAARGRTYHLAAGLQASATIADVVGHVLAVMRSHPNGPRNIEQPRIVPAHAVDHLLSDADKRAFDYSPQKLLLRSYAPYMAQDRDFQVSRTHELLAAAGIVLQDVGEVIRRTTAYALEVRHARGAAAPRPMATESIQH